MLKFKILILVILLTGGFVPLYKYVLPLRQSFMRQYCEPFKWDEVSPYCRIPDNDTELFVITTTYNDAEQYTLLEDIAESLKDQSDIHWIVIEDSWYVSEKIRKVITNLMERNSTLSYTHIAVPTPISQRDYFRPYAVYQKNIALDYVRILQNNLSIKDYKNANIKCIECDTYYDSSHTFTAGMSDHDAQFTLFHSPMTFNRLLQNIAEKTPSILETESLKFQRETRYLSEIEKKEKLSMGDKFLNPNKIKNAFLSEDNEKSSSKKNTRNLKVSNNIVTDSSVIEKATDQMKNSDSYSKEKTVSQNTKMNVPESEKEDSKDIAKPKNKVIKPTKRSSLNTGYLSIPIKLSDEELEKVKTDQVILTLKEYTNLIEKFFIITKKSTSAPTRLLIDENTIINLKGVIDNISDIKNNSSNKQFVRRLGSGELDYLSHKSGVYFAETNFIFDPVVFDMAKRVKRVAIFPVGPDVNGASQGPVCSGLSVTSINVANPSNLFADKRKFPIKFGGLSISAKYLLKNLKASMERINGGVEDSLLAHLIEEKNDFETINMCNAPPRVKERVVETKTEEE